MLEKLLQEIRSGGTLETNRLALKLGVTPALIALMLEHLQRTGYIHTYTACAEACAGCALAADGCSSSACSRQQTNDQSLRLWQSVSDPSPRQPSRGGSSPHVK